MTTGHIDRTEIELAKQQLVAQRAAARQKKITTTLAGIEVDLEELVLANPGSPVLTLVGKLLATGSTEDALLALAEELGEDGFMRLLQQLGNQPQPAQQAIPAQAPPAALPSGQAPLQGQAIRVPEYMNVYDEHGRLEPWTIRSTDTDAHVRARTLGYERTVVNGEAAYQKVPAAPARTAPQPAAAPAAPSWLPRRRDRR